MTFRKFARPSLRGSNPVSVLFLCMLAMLTSCGKSSTSSGGGGVPTVAITASPVSIAAGQSTSLIVTAANATSVVVSNNLDQTTYTLPPNGGSQTVSPRLTAVYTASATGPNGPEDRATVTVTVNSLITATFVASPAAIFSGQASTLSWTSTNATSAVIDNGIDAVQVNGSIVVNPTQTTTYNITLTGSGTQTTAAATVTVKPGPAVTSFKGLGQDPASPQGDIDPNGAVGTKQFMEYVNTAYQAYDKDTHAPVWTLPQPIGTPWQNIPQCAGKSIRLDGVVTFDRMASRWVIMGKTTRQTTYNFCIAVSKTDDLSSCSTNPVACWYAYSFVLDPALGATNGGVVYFPDWPRIGTWWDGYYTTFDLVDEDGGDVNLQNNVVGVTACAFDRDGMLAGELQSALKPMQCKRDPDITQIPNSIYVGHSLIPADVDGTTAPPTGRDEYLASIQNPVLDNTTTTSSVFNLWAFHVDWTNPANTTFTRVSQPTVPTYTPGCYLPGLPALTNCVPEPASGQIGQHVDSVGDRFMPRLAYRNFGSYESFLVSHTVQTGSGDGTQDGQQTGIRWYELRGSGTPAVFQSGTISPDTSLFRFLPSIAQDKAGNAAVGYSVSSDSINPGISASFWNLPDSTALAEFTLLNGTQEEVTPGTGVGAWGTYDSMTVDPVDDCTFWYVNEYWDLPTGQTSVEWQTLISNFKVPGCS